MGASPFFSIIIPVYNRPGEVDELLRSLTHQTFTDFEVLLIEDGSTITSKTVYEQYAYRLTIHYFVKPNTGPGPSRNFGFERARGNYFVVFDSDCIIPPHYLQTVKSDLDHYHWDAWGGPDRGHEQFTPTQQAMAYTMSSVLTTGGIRGAKSHAGNFQPRSFNMGFSRKVFEVTRGFRFDRFAEDIELSIRIKKAGFKVGLIPDAYVFHKRRTSFSQFFKQVSNFGKGRALVGRAHPGEIKITHWFPFFFVIGLMLLPFIFLFSLLLGKIALLGYALYAILIFMDSFQQTKSWPVAFLSVPSALIQLTGYGFGFFTEWSGLLRSNK